MSEPALDQVAEVRRREGQSAPDPERCWHNMAAPGDRYCGECARALLWSCVGVDCRRDNRIAARFCRQCGRARDAK